MDLTDFLPTEVSISTGANRKLLALATDNVIKLRYLTPVSNQYVNMLGKRLHDFEIPRKVSSNFRVLGLLEAEMSKGKNNGKIQFVNSEPKIIKMVIGWFKEFGLEKKDWKWRITVNKKLGYHKNKEIVIEEFWKKEVGLLNGNFRGFRYLEYKGSMRENTSIWGSATIEGGNTALRGVIVGIVESVLNNLIYFPNKEKMEFLDGFCSGESCINRRRVITAVKDDRKREIIKRAMNSLDIDMNKEWPSKGAHSIVTGGFSDLFKVYKYRICKAHPEKWSRILCDLLSIQRFDENAKSFKKEFIEVKKQIQIEYNELEEFLDNRKEAIK